MFITHNSLYFEYWEGYTCKYWFSFYDNKIMCITGKGPMAKKGKVPDIGTNDRVSVFLELAEAHTALGETVSLCQIYFFRNYFTCTFIQSFIRSTVDFFFKCEFKTPLFHHLVSNVENKNKWMPNICNNFILYTTIRRKKIKRDFNICTMNFSWFYKLTILCIY